jgi:16S rRNA (adenine1518-N6/adenine1519-N6)-dimethyltransferase
VAVRALLDRHGIRPSRRRGQNFLIDRNTLERVVAAAGLTSDDGVLEIGPGLGILTQALAAAARRVLAVEVDAGLARVLAAETLQGLDNVTLLHADFLELDLPAALRECLGEGRHKAVANIPYSITSPVLVRLLEHHELLERIVLMVQKEVALRLAARPGTGDYGSLTVFAQFHAEVDIVGTVSRNCFLPAPEVDSAIVRLRLRREPRFPGLDERRFFAVVHAAFQQRRKNLLNSLSGSGELSLEREQATAALAATGIDAGRRGETLALEEFARLAAALPAH